MATGYQGLGTDYRIRDGTRRAGAGMVSLSGLLTYTQLSMYTGTSKPYSADANSLSTLPH